MSAPPKPGSVTHWAGGAASNRKCGCHPPPPWVTSCTIVPGRAATAAGVHVQGSHVVPDDPTVVFTASVIVWAERPADMARTSDNDSRDLMCTSLGGAPFPRSMPPLRDCAGAST